MYLIGDVAERQGTPLSTETTPVRIRSFSFCSALAKLALRRTVNADGLGSNPRGRALSGVGLSAGPRSLTPKRVVQLHYAQSVVVQWQDATLWMSSLGFKSLRRNTHG